MITAYSVVIRSFFIERRINLIFVYFITLVNIVKRKKPFT